MRRSIDNVEKLDRIKVKKAEAKRIAAKKARRSIEELIPENPLPKMLPNFGIYGLGDFD